MKQEEMRIIYKYKPVMDRVTLWLTLCDVLKEECLLFEKYEIDDKLKTVNQVEKLLSHGEPLIVKDKNFSFFFGSVWAGEFQQFIIDKEKDVKVNWDLWIKKLSNMEVFVYAWKGNSDYSYWQNNDSIDSYKWNSKPYEHLPMKKSNLPLPLPQIVIDTSKNPGREVFKTGYVESVGSTMWLSDEFFLLTGADKETVKSTDWLETSELKPGILKVKAQETCFTESEGKEAELQNKMRDLLYPGHD